MRTLNGEEYSENNPDGENGPKDFLRKFNISNSPTLRTEEVKGRNIYIFGEKII